MEQIPLFKVYMDPNAKIEVGKVLDSGYIGQGKKVEEFETKLKEYFNVDKLLTLNSGTSALHLAIHLLKKQTSDWPGVYPGDEVLTTALTCTATNWPILANGLNIKWVDIDEKNLNIDLDDLERKITSKTKIIMAVHWGGYPVDLKRLKKIQQRSYELYGFRPMIIEDGAHSFGTEYNGKKLGNNGNIVVYSLQAIKHITSIDGGILILPNQELYNRAKLVRWYGIDREHNSKDFRCEADVIEWGFKFHMNDVNATVGIENLKHANEILNIHRNNAKFYDTYITNPDVTLLERKDYNNSAFWIYSMKVKNRFMFYAKMKEYGIMVSQVHERNDKHTAVRSYKTFLPTLDRVLPDIVSIPVGWWVTNNDRQYIVDCINGGW